MSNPATQMSLWTVLGGLLIGPPGSVAGPCSFQRDFAPAENIVAPPEEPFRRGLCLNGRWQFQPAPVPKEYRRDQGIPPELPPPAAGAWDTTLLKVPSPWNVNTWGCGRKVGPGTPRPYWPSSLYYPSYPESWDAAEMGWLRRTFRVPDGWTDKRILLYFEAVAGQCQVFVNGRKAGEHFDKYLPFQLDVTRLVRRGADNELLVGVRDHRLYDKAGQKYRKMIAPYPCGSNTDGLVGIWQDVYLLGLPSVRVENVFVKPLVDRDTLELEVTIRNDTQEQQRVRLDGAIHPWVNLGDCPDFRVSENGTVPLDASALGKGTVPFSSDENRTLPKGTVPFSSDENRDSPPPKGDPRAGLSVVDADTLTESGLAEAKRALDRMRDARGIVLVFLGPDKARLQALESLFPASVRLTDRRATALVADAEHPWVAPFSLPALYFAEDGTNRFILQHGLEGPLAERGRVLLKASDTDWSLLNDAGENAKCAASVLYEHLAKPGGAALLECEHGQGKLVLSTLDWRITSRAADEFWRKLLANMGVKLRDPREGAVEAFDEEHSLVNALSIGRFGAESVDAALKRDFIGEKSAKPKKGTTSGGSTWTAVNSPGKDRFVLRDLNQNGPVESQGLPRST